MDNNPEPAMPKLYNNIDISPAEGDKTSDGKMSEPNNKKINTSISPKNPEKHTDNMRKRKTTDWNSDHENTSGEEIDCNNSDSDIFDGEPFPTTSYENTSGERITKKRKSTTNVLDDIEAQPLHHSKRPNCSKPNPAVLLTRL